MSDNESIADAVWTASFAPWAKAAGEAAGAAGEPESACPYPAEDPMREWWLTGHHQGALVLAALGGDADALRDTGVKELTTPKGKPKNGE